MLTMPLPILLLCHHIPIPRRHYYFISKRPDQYLSELVESRIARIVRPQIRRIAPNREAHNRSLNCLPRENLERHLRCSGNGHRI